ncbi:DUF6159 family protein [Mycobacterium sp. E2479]|uniref:DUF6159 family protein n=1 Tax=Mycobacterium sp. E2479 TaxID=1834134 RepID=UPI0007FFA534|nr:DUF6159 family protein [Mycobacterium sp. E2479]OBH61851.1 hypothetical protein A5686_19445 [Mycobacterium sp. E2479]
MGRIRRGWALSKQSWEVLKKDRSLVFFPILSTLFAALATIAIWAPTLLVRGVFQGHQVDNQDPVYYLAGAATAYASTFIAIFFNVALAACAVRSMRGEDTRVAEGINAAARRIVPILGWTLVATTVGLLLKAVEERLPNLGKLVADLIGAAWAVATFFVIPAIALEGTGPFQSLRRSVDTIKARWGESAAGAATIGVVTFLLALVVVVGGVVGGFALIAARLAPLGLAVLAATFAFAVVISFVSTALSQIFRVAVYQFAVTGETVGGFDPRLLQAAFVAR